MMTSAPAFNAWLDDFFASYFRRRPVNATFTGMYDHDAELPDLSARGMADTAGDTEDLLARLHALPNEALGDAEQLDRRLAQGFLRIQRWESGSAHFGWHNPSLFTGEAIFGVLGILLRTGLSFEARLVAVTPRLAEVPEFLDRAMKDLLPAPAAWIERARRECTGARLLLADLHHPQAEPAGAAFARFDAFLEAELEPHATEDYACGSEAFDLLLRQGHFLEMGADDLERLALERLADEASTLEGLPQATADPEEQDAPPYLERFQRVWRAARDLADNADLLTFPDWPVQYVEQPEWARAAAPYLYFLPYRSPPPLDTPEVVEYYVPAGADETTIKLNHVVHHGSLGHHVQNWNAARAASRIGRVAAVDCAARIAMLCGGTMAEGWACYAVDLADEAGFLTPAEHYAQHHTRLRMAARAIVDIRLHDGRFSLAESIAFYAEHVGMTAAAARAEAVKNSLFPGTASMYLAGWDAIRRLGREWSSRQPAAGSLRQFHDRLLSFGSVPVSLVARMMLARSPVAQHL